MQIGRKPFSSNRPCTTPSTKSPCSRGSRGFPPIPRAPRRRSRRWRSIIRIWRFRMTSFVPRYLDFTSSFRCSSVACSACPRPAPSATIETESRWRSSPGEPNWLGMRRRQMCGPGRCCYCLFLLEPSSLKSFFKLYGIIVPITQASLVSKAQFRVLRKRQDWDNGNDAGPCLIVQK